MASLRPAPNLHFTRRRLSGTYFVCARLSRLRNGVRCFYAFFPTTQFVYSPFSFNGDCPFEFMQNFICYLFSDSFQ